MAVQRHKAHVATALVQASKAVRVEQNIDAFHALTRIYSRLNLALDACDHALMDEETGRYIVEPAALAGLIAASAELRRTIETAAKLMSMLQEQRERTARQEDAARDLSEMLSPALLAECVVELVGQELAEQVGAYLSPRLVDRLLERGGG